MTCPYASTIFVLCDPAVVFATSFLDDLSKSRQARGQTRLFDNNKVDKICFKGTFCSSPSSVANASITNTSSKYKKEQEVKIGFKIDQMLCCGLCCGNMSKRDYKVATMDGIELEPLGGEKMDKDKEKDKEKQQTNGVTFVACVVWYLILRRSDRDYKIKSKKRFELALGKTLDTALSNSLLLSTLSFNDCDYDSNHDNNNEDDDNDGDDDTDDSDGDGDIDNLRLNVE
uniref:Uncharacterized protein n=1 Tax=Glossina austeni TaxID=7395 RepID=A0A1A9VPY7_GLOAU